MPREELLNRYDIVVKSLKGIKIYSTFIIFLCILAFCLQLENFTLFLLIVSLNCLINYIFFKKICNYLEHLNVLFANVK